MTDTTRPLGAITVCGPSGVGKGTLLGRLMRTYPDRFGYSVSHTTRAPREGEVNGREYHFVDRPTMEKLRDSGEFLEVCEVHGNLYGTTVKAVKDVQDTGNICIIETDVKGAQKLRERASHLNMLYIFFNAPSMEDLRERIKKRGADSEEVLQHRLETAEEELQFLKENPGFFSHVIVNKDLEKTYEELLSIVNATLEKHDMAKLEDGSLCKGK
ncbi:guanylate kinase [Trypanosoma grayi]|uniref:guanylate kinase n=1 Tax=Trypanosoma grayi TaxID=71804 RepID=UPI0004F46048|nr:guanylate kinase [Trypanosoma grayi]KEG10274.1 guanylate kinase [Trypanosoma grayi]